MSQAKVEKVTDGLDWDFIRKEFCALATDKEFAVFKATCEANDLNPITRTAYFVKYKPKPGQRQMPGQVVVGYQVYIQRAEMSGKLDGWKVEHLDNPARARVTIYRKDWSKPFEHEARASEFSSNVGVHKTAPRFMLGKVAISQGFRMAFPCELGTMPYTQDEINTFTDNPDKPVKPAPPETLSSGKPSIEKRRETAKEYTEKADIPVGVVEAFYGKTFDKLTDGHLQDLKKKLRAVRDGFAPEILFEATVQPQGETLTVICPVLPEGKNKVDLTYCLDECLDTDKADCVAFRKAAKEDAITSAKK